MSMVDLSHLGLPEAVVVTVVSGFLPVTLSATFFLSPPSCAWAGWTATSSVSEKRTARSRRIRRARWREGRGMSGLAGWYGLDPPGATPQEVRQIQRRGRREHGGPQRKSRMLLSAALCVLCDLCVDVLSRVYTSGDSGAAAG